MKKWLRILLYILLSLFVLAVIVAISADFYVESKIKTMLQKDLPKHLRFTYDDLRIKSLHGSLIFEKPHLTISNKEDHTEHTFILSEGLHITNFSYWNYIFKDEIHLDEIRLEKPSLVFYKDRVIKAKDSTSTRTESFKQKVLLDRLNLSDGTFTIIDKEKDSVFLYLQNISVQLNKISTSGEQVKHMLPFDFSDLQMAGDSLFIKAGTYENLASGAFEITKNSALINDIHFYTKYSVKTLNNIIPYERDHYDLSMSSLEIQDLKLITEQDSLTSAGAKKVILGETDFQVYRDKTVKKDTTFKPLYNRSLRQLPFNLSVDSLIISGADIVYTERHLPENNGGIISFKNLEAKIANVGNTYEENIDARIRALFMDETPFTAQWRLNVHSPEDHFLFQAEVQRFNASNMDRFIGPNLDANLVGTAEHTYFTIDGNNENSRTNVKIKYTDLKLNLLKKDSKKKKEILSAIVNLAIPKNSANQGAEFNDGAGTAERHKTQSVFNQLWISLESALKDAMLPGIVKKLAD